MKYRKAYQYWVLPAYRESQGIYSEVNRNRYLGSSILVSVDWTGEQTALNITQVND